MKKGRPKPPKPKHQHIVIQKRESYPSFATGATDQMRLGWKPNRSVNQKRYGEPQVRELFERDPRGEEE